MRILYNNLADTATIARVSGTDALPASNLSTKERENVWRTALGTTSATLEVRFADGQKAVNMICLYRSNLTQSATWRVQMWTDDTMTTQTYDSGTGSAVAVTALGDLEWGVDPLGKTLYTDWGHVVSTLWLASTVYGNYMRIDVTDSGSTDSYLQASRLFVGQFWEPTYAPKRGMQTQWVDTSKQQRTDGGTVHVEPGSQYRRMSVAGEWMTEAERIQATNIFRAKGLREDMFVSVFPQTNGAYERDHQMQCVLSSIGPITLPMYQRANIGFTFEEI